MNCAVSSGRAVLHRQWEHMAQKLQRTHPAWASPGYPPQLPSSRGQLEVVPPTTTSGNLLLSANVNVSAGRWMLMLVFTLSCSSNKKICPIPSRRKCRPRIQNDVLWPEPPPSPCAGFLAHSTDVPDVDGLS